MAAAAAAATQLLQRSSAAVAGLGCRHQQQLHKVLRRPVVARFAAGGVLAPRAQHATTAAGGGSRSLPGSCVRQPPPQPQQHLQQRSARLPVMAPTPCAGGGAFNSSGGGGRGSTIKRFSSSGSGGSGSGGGGGLWAAYNELLGKYPLLVKALTTAVLSALGNVICQLAVEGKSQLDWRRLNTFTALGFVWVAPCLHFWFGTLNRLVTNPGNAGALMRMALDQLGFAPLFIGSMLAILAALDGKTADQAFGVVRSDLPAAIKANWALWVPAQFLNFRFVPPSYQVLFANVVALVWNVYFSFATRPKTA